MKRLSVWFRRIVLALLGAVLLYQFWLFGWVLWWGQVNPAQTRFMEIRLAELQIGRAHV